MSALLILAAILATVAAVLGAHFPVWETLTFVWLAAIFAVAAEFGGQ